MPLHSQQVYRNDEQRQDQAESSAPPEKRVAQEVELDLIVAPSAHPQSGMEPRPFRGSRGEDILLVRIRNESVVGSHHRNVEVYEVAEEWRLVEVLVAGWDCSQVDFVSYYLKLPECWHLRRSFQWLSTFHQVCLSLGLFSLSQDTSTCLKPQGGKTAFAARM